MPANRANACAAYNFTIFPRFSTACAGAAQLLHRRLADWPLRRMHVQVQSQIMEMELVKGAAAVCPLCDGTGWKPVGESSNGVNTARRVVRCDCRARSRHATLLASAHIPKRYEH